MAALREEEEKKVTGPVLLALTRILTAVLLTYPEDAIKGQLPPVMEFVNIFEKRHL